MPIIYLPPAGLDHHCWDMTGLRGEMPDYPGHGDRPLGPAGDFTMERLADDIADAYPGDLHLVGCAMGGLVAQHVAIRHPQRVKSMLLASTRTDGGRDPSGLPPEAGWPVDMLMARAAAARRDGMEGVLELTLSRWFPPEALNDPTHWGVRYARRRLLDNDREAFAATWAALAKSAARDFLPDVRVPVTVLAGRHDLASPLARALELYDLLPNSRFEIIDGGHALPAEFPAAFAHAVQRHFDWVASVDRGLDFSAGRFPA